MIPFGCFLSFLLCASEGVWEISRKTLDSSREIEYFCFLQLTNYLSRYILDNKTRLFDVRNHMVVICREDPLGEAFGLDAFHRSQVT